MTRLRRRGQHQGKTSRLEQEDLSNEEVLANVEELERQVIDLLNTVADANCRLVRFNNDHEQQDGEAIGRLANAIELLLKNAEDCPAKFVSTYLTESTSKITIE
ncbi:hypothetical protein UC8_06200 [Roseimaritima ulvae]|uniref:Uncharacterized protein n=2 Tax=Roseimaritima ulvae TaxID=980254 RepID=A0A5B9QLI0_9BACT|nr:hypothetical protein UC8_06200 [Roseimaritima ulvae]